MRIERASKIGFCFGVKRAISTLERVAVARGGVETLGAVVHNEQVLQRLAALGVKIVKSVEEVKGSVVVTSSHGVSPQVKEAIRARGLDIISTTCPFVRRAQVAAKRLADAGFRVVVFGETDHPEVRGILGWANEKGLATKDASAVAVLQPVPRYLGILSQTTQVPAHFAGFVKGVIDSALVKDAEIRIIDTICHDIRERQAAALELAGRSDLMIVVGGRSSANTRHLVELCSTRTETRLVETAAGLKLSWLKGCKHIGIAAGASTADETVNEVVEELKATAGP